MTEPMQTNAAVARAAEHEAAGRYDDAVSELAKAAESGDVNATTELGKHLIIGDLGPHLPQDGTRLLVDAVAAGGVEAALRLATLAALGSYVEQSWSRALGMLLFAAEKGSPAARGQLQLFARRRLADAEPPASEWRRLAESVDFATWITPARSVSLHDDPAVRSFPEFTEDEVCAWLIERARGNLRRALVYDASHGSDITDHMRTNTAAGFDLMTADLVQVALQYRMATSVGLPIDNMEGPTVLHYEVGEEITNHYDFLNPGSPNYQDEISRRGERIITFLVYLNDDYGGGETEFPKLGIRHKGKRCRAARPTCAWSMPALRRRAARNGSSRSSSATAPCSIHAPSASRSASALGHRSSSSRSPKENGGPRAPAVDSASSATIRSSA
jgi:prolyl 4-hydroxylase